MNQPHLFNDDDQNVVDRYIVSHGGEGILTPHDVVQLNAAERRVFEYLKSRDGQWTHPDEICRVAGKPGHPAREGLRRMRALRQLPDWDIERTRGTGRVFFYRLVRRSVQ